MDGNGNWGSCERDGCFRQPRDRSLLLRWLRSRSHLLFAHNDAGLPLFPLCVGWHYCTYVASPIGVCPLLALGDVSDSRPASPMLQQTEGGPALCGAWRYRGACNVFELAGATARVRGRDGKEGPTTDNAKDIHKALELKIRLSCPLLQLHLHLIPRPFYRFSIANLTTSAITASSKITTQNDNMAPYTLKWGILATGGIAQSTYRPY